MRDMKVGRRDFLALGMTGAAALFAYGLLRDQGSGVLLRPPGAQDEVAFATRCLRCGECVRACLTQCLEPAGKGFGAARLWTPRFNPALGKCEFELCGRACAQACPVGAIREPDDADVRIGTAAVTRSKCIAWNEGKACLVCYERCSYAAIEIDSRGRPRVLADKCTGCGACQNTCVTCPDPAIMVYSPGAAPLEGGGNNRRGN
ncbi:MAG: 4Fe-4S dicluster domain-containing protein [Actinomycetota bacterium]|nr:4Fe-4S dicluster domain-containing protein [Actinomycetota bacterium]